MGNIRIVIGKNEELPLKHREKLFILKKAYDSERLPFEPPKIEFYKNLLNLPKLTERDTLQLFVFDNNDELIGFGYSGWNIKYDNFHRAFAQVFIEPPKRRRGYGTQILLKLVNNLPNQINTASFSAKEGSAGEAFLKSFKNESSFAEIINAADLSEFNLEEIKEIVQNEEKRLDKLGYKFVALEGLDYIEKFNEVDYVRMVERIWNDMPREELSFGEDVIPIERYKAMVEHTLKKGDRNFGYAIALKETNEPVGHTRVLYNKFDLDTVEQDDTGVVLEHRGKGFGLALKYKILEQILTEINAKYWFTGNAGSNEHMIRINEKLKHKIVSKIVIYELKREEWELI
ncbi:MAG: GNAT family N-acetyltransferase [Asgard group archaeon]|nr:GNAT family N-acetyltransferase [Asgard group archaeon]